MVTLNDQLPIVKTYCLLQSIVNDPADNVAKVVIDSPDLEQSGRWQATQGTIQYLGLVNRGFDIRSWESSPQLVGPRGSLNSLISTFLYSMHVLHTSLLYYSYVPCHTFPLLSSDYHLDTE